MKSRNGFISNSSSTSFIVYSELELTRDRIKELVELKFNETVEDKTKNEEYYKDIEILTDNIYHQIDKEEDCVLIESDESGDVFGVMEFIVNKDLCFSTEQLLKIFKDYNNKYMYKLTFGSDGGYDEYEGYLETYIEKILEPLCIVD